MTVADYDEASAPRAYLTEEHYPALARALRATRHAIAALLGDDRQAHAIAFLERPGWVKPLPYAADGRAPVISDGYHSRDDLAAGRARRTHRGCDLMYWRPLNRRGSIRHPWQSAGFEILPGTVAIAAGAGRVTVARKLATGWAVCIEHRPGLETAYHHLAGVTVRVGDDVNAGATVGLVGGSPKGYGLVHLHFDLVVAGRYVDPGPYLKAWPVVAARSSSTLATASS